MLSINDIKLGTIIAHKGQPYQVIYTQHVKMGRGGANLKTKLKKPTWSAARPTFCIATDPTVILWTTPAMNNSV